MPSSSWFKQAVSLPMVALLSLGACSKEERSAEPAAPVAEAPALPVPTAEPSKASATKPEPESVGRGMADLTLTGAITQQLKGQVVVCGSTFLEGRNQGGSWAIRGDDLDFTIMALGDVDFDAPTVILNVKQPNRVQYVLNRKAGNVSVARDRTLAKIDTDLREIVGTGKVHVKGTMTCPPK